MGLDLTEKTYVCVRSNGLLFWVPAEGLSYIMSGDALKRAIAEEDDSRAEPTAVLDGRRVRVRSLRALLGFPPERGERYALILPADGGLYGLLVDEVVETLSAAPDAVTDLPEAARCPENEFLIGVALQEARGALAYLLDLTRLLAEEG